MIRRSTLCFLLNVSGESPSFRAKPVRNLQMDVQMSPYKEQFIEYWSTPVPWADREYGEKPKLGDPIPTRRAATTIIVGKNKYIDLEKVKDGEDNDYKVLMMFREGKGRFTKDQFILPASPVSLDDSSEDWDKILRRRGVTTKWPDLHHRLTSMRALFAQMNILLIPKEGGGLVEVEGPPGPKKWHLLCYSFPKAMRQLVEVLELPMETSLSQLTPFCRVITPVTETFRFDNLSYIVPFEKIPDLRFTISTLGEKLVWVSPMEALARYNAGIMNMPSANIILMSELNNRYPTFSDVQQKTPFDEANVVQPELLGCPKTNFSTVVLPGDIFHSATTPEDLEKKYVRRLVYEKCTPFGVRAVFDERVASTEELDEKLVTIQPKLLEEANDIDMVYANIPYAKSSSEMGVTKNGHTAYPVPEYSFHEGKENSDGFIPAKRTNLTNKVIDIHEQMKK